MLVMLLMLMLLLNQNSWNYSKMPREMDLLDKIVNLYAEGHGASSSDNPNFKGGVTSEAVKKLMKKHGVDALYPTKDPDTFYFLRNNKKINVAMPKDRFE